MLTSKFWRSVYKDGYIRTFLKNQRAALKDTQYVGGHEGLVKCVGQDHFGNKYFEDLSVDHQNNRRYVEFANCTASFEMTSDRLAPEWVGWLAKTYDDLPSEGKNFVNHSYIKRSNERQVDGSGVKLPQGYQHFHNFVDRNEFIQDQKYRKSIPWEILGQDVGCIMYSITLRKWNWVEGE